MTKTVRPSFTVTDVIYEMAILEILETREERISSKTGFLAKTNIRWILLWVWTLRDCGGLVVSQIASSQSGHWFECKLIKENGYKKGQKQDSAWHREKCFKKKSVVQMDGTRTADRCWVKPKANV